MKKLLAIVLCLCMIAGMTPVTVSAASQVNIFNITVVEPKVGKKPSTKGSVPTTASTTVTNVEWVGNFANDGTFASGEEYTVYVTCTIKKGQDKFLKFVNKKAKINTNFASFVSLSSDKQSIVLKYTFPKTEGKSNETTTNNNTTNTNKTSNEIVEVTLDDISVNDYEWEVLRLTNVERAKEGLYLLSMPEELQQPCNVREKEIATFYSHDRPDGTDCFTAIDSKFKKKVTLGENIAKGQKNPAQVVDAWMHSEGHRANILHTDFGYLGVGYGSDANTWVQLFAGRKQIIKVEASTGKTAFTEKEILSHYLRISTKDGYVSYLPLDFNSMTKNADGTYSPSIPVSGLPSYTKLKEGSTDNSGNAGNNTQTGDETVIIIENKDLTEDAERIKKAVENDTDKSKFTKTGLLNIARAVVKNGTVVTWSEYKETPATTSKEGVISGVFTLTLNKDSMDISISKTIPKLPDTGTSDSIFERYIPIENVYGAYITQLLDLKKGEAYRFALGTQFADEASTLPPVPFNPIIKRSKYEGGYVKVNYLGTYGTVDEALGNKQLNIITSDDYKALRLGNISDNAKSYGLSKDTVVISVDLYDKNKKFVCTISPACVIIATSKNGDFLTFSRYMDRTCSLYFTNQGNLFPANADNGIQTQSMYFYIDKIMVDKKSVASALLPLQTESEEAYEFIQYPALTGTPMYNANKILSDEEFVSPENTYYQVTRVGDSIDPVIMHKIENVISYSMYQTTIGVGYYQRNVVAGDGTLYGITTKDEKIEIAKNVKKTGAHHYLTNDGVLKELNGKVVTKNCVDFAESYDFRILGVLKEDGCLYLGYSYYAGGEEYEKGLSKKLKNVTHIVPTGAYTKNNTFYRWHETITPAGMDEKAWERGEFISYNKFELSVVQICKNVERVFPYEYLTKIWGASQDMDDNITSFVQTKTGELFGYGLKYDKSFGIYNGKVERIFPMFSSHQDGNFIGIKVEGDDHVYAIVARYCDHNLYLQGKFGVNGYQPKFLSETLDGFLAEDGIVYSIDSHPLVIVDDYIDGLQNIRGNLTQMDCMTQTYHALNSTTMETIPLLPSVGSWYFDERQIVLLEREDGSVWASSFLSKSVQANLSAKLGGYENSNVIQISGPQTKKLNAEYITFDKK